MTKLIKNLKILKSKLKILRNDGTKVEAKTDNKNCEKQ